MMSLCPKTLYGQQVSNTRERNRSIARRLNCNLCPSTAVQVSCFVFFSQKSKTVHKAYTKRNMRGFYITGINGLLYKGPCVQSDRQKYCSV